MLYVLLFKSICEYRESAESDISAHNTKDVLLCVSRWFLDANALKWDAKLATSNYNWGQHRHFQHTILIIRYHSHKSLLPLALIHCLLWYLMYVYIFQQGYGCICIVLVQYCKCTLMLLFSVTKGDWTAVLYCHGRVKRFLLDGHRKLAARLACHGILLLQPPGLINFHLKTHSGNKCFEGKLLYGNHLSNSGEGPAHRFSAGDSQCIDEYAILVLFCRFMAPKANASSGSTTMTLTLARQLICWEARTA